MNIKSAWVFAVIVPTGLLSGCTTAFTNVPVCYNTFFLLDGNGPLEYHQTGLIRKRGLRQVYEALSHEKARALEKESTATVPISWEGKTWFTRGTFQASVSRDEYDFRTVCVRKMSGFEARWTKYNDSGTPIAWGRSAPNEPLPIILGPLITWGIFFNHYSYTKPTGDSNYALTPSGLAHFNAWPKELHENFYEDKYGWSILAGIVGWGRVNRRNYMQFLWIPIPLGDTDAVNVPESEPLLE